MASNKKILITLATIFGGAFIIGRFLKSNSNKLGAPAGSAPEGVHSPGETVLQQSNPAENIIQITSLPPTIRRNSSVVLRREGTIEEGSTTRLFHTGSSGLFGVQQRIGRFLYDHTSFFKKYVAKNDFQNQ